MAARRDDPRTSAGALTGSIAAIDRFEELEEFLLGPAARRLRPNWLWRLPLLSAFTSTSCRRRSERLGDLNELGGGAAGAAEREPVVVATDASPASPGVDLRDYELTQSSRHTPPGDGEQSSPGCDLGAVPPMRVGSRIATDGSGAQLPLAHAYARPGVRLIVGSSATSRST